MTSSTSKMVPTCCETNSQSPWVTPSGLSMEMRTRRLLPPPLTSTSTISMPSDSATLRAISSIFDVTGDCIVANVPEPTKKWAFAHQVDPTSNYSVAPGCKGRVVGWRLKTREERILGAAAGSGLRSGADGARLGDRVGGASGGKGVCRIGDSQVLPERSQF